jgi:hypothetical protein
LLIVYVENIEVEGLKKMENDKEENAKDKKRERIIFFNANTDRRAAKGTINAQAFPDCVAEVRHPRILDEIVVPHLSTELTATIVLFELNTQQCNFFAKEALSKGYHIAQMVYNLSPASFRFLAISNKPFRSDIPLAYALTESGFFYEGERDKSKEHLDETYEEFEKCMFRVQSADGTLIYTTHLGLGNHAKMKQMARIRDILLKVVPKNVNFVLGGDFNCFDRDSADQKYMPGMLELLDSHFNRPTHFLTSTFDCWYFPYDIEYQLSSEKKGILQRLRDEKDVNNYRNFLLEERKKVKTQGLALDHVYTNICNGVHVTAAPVQHLSDHDAIVVVIYYN